MEKPINPYRSDDINLIMGALASAQGSYKRLKSNQDAPGGKFANLEDILTATRESLSQNGLAFFQYIDLLDEGSGQSLLTSVLGHSSGQWISSKSRIVFGKTDKQTSNTLEINKRLAAAMLLGIAMSSNDPDAYDDNGLEQTENLVLEQIKKPKGKDIDYNETISKEQYNDLMIELDDYPEIVKGIQETYDIQSLADLPKSEYHPAMRQIRKLIQRYGEYSKARQ